MRVYIPDLPPTDELIPFLRRMDASRRYSNFGPLEREFAAAAAQRLDPVAPPAVATASSGTAALTLALRALELPRQARVLTPALTFPATAAAILEAGLAPVLADVDPASWTLTPAIAATLQDDVSAVVPVATYGCALPAEAWDAFASETGVKVVFDAAGAFGRQAVPIHCPVVFSLHATKTLGVGEGGLVASRDAAFVDRVQRLSNFGFSNFVVQASSGNAKMSEHHAAVGLAQLARADRLLAAKARLAQLYRRHLRGVVLQAGEPAVLVVRLPSSARAVAAALADDGIETRFWYHPDLAEQPAFAGCDRGPLSVTTALRDRLIGLPFHTLMADADVERVGVALAAALAS